MSDDFDDDSFMADDSFLAELDSLTATASTGTSGPKAPAHRTTSLPVISRSLPGAHTSFGRSNTLGVMSLIKPAVRSTVNAVAGPSSRPRHIPQPPSDDFDDDDFDIPTESLALIDDIAAGRPPPPPIYSSSSSGSTRPAPIPSSRLGMGRTLGRTSSGSGGFQTHLNFRKENQATAGKRWDRTAFAESGRRVDAKTKGKVRQWGYDDDEIFSDDGDAGDMLAPAPKPLVDISEY